MTADLKPGDRVREKRTGATGTISGVPEGRDYARVRWDIYPSLRDPVALSDIEPAPAPTAPTVATPELKPGDRVRDNRIWTVEAVHGDSAHLSLDGHTRLAGIHYLEPVPAAPASEPEMRESVAGLIRSHVRLVWTGHDHADIDYRSTLAAAEAIIARHLAERDAQIEEVIAEGKEWRDMYVTASDARYAAEDRARAAEAALAEEREANAKVADKRRARCLAKAKAATNERSAGLWESAADEAGDIAEIIRSRTITAEGADTGSAQDADA